MDKKPLETNENKCCENSDKTNREKEKNKNKCGNKGTHSNQNHDKKHTCKCGEDASHSCSCGHSDGHENACCCHGGYAKKEVGKGLKFFTYAVGGLMLCLAFLSEFEQVDEWLGFLFSALVYVFFAKSVWISAVMNVLKKRFFTEFSLMCVASLGAICLGEFAEASAVVYFYSLGELISEGAYKASRRNISSLIELNEDRATVIRDKKAVSVPAGEVAVGEIVAVRVGDRISLDGVVVSGSGFVDTSAVTGESLPAELERGDGCLAGSLLVSGAIYINVTEKYENSTVNKLKKAIEQAEKRKSAREKKISRFASVFTPIAFGAAVAVFALCLLLGRGFTASFKTSLVVLVASCPCSLVLSVPLAYFSCIGRAAKRGIVFRGGQTIDNVEKIETVILDKTGTLTSSRPEFIGILLPKDPPVQKVVALDYAKAALLKSPHALAGVFCEKYTETVSYHAEGVKIIGGRGLGCLIGGKKVALGNKKLMDEIGVKVDEVDKSVIYLSVDGEYCAALLFDAKLKENALMEVSALRANGVKRVAIMSGDTAKTVKSVADEVGVDEFYAELKPDEKLRRLEYIYKEGKRSSPCGTLAFCGDGLNDSAAIARADVGVAMGSGSAFTLESADVVIVDDNLERLNDMIRMARKTSAIVNANIMISLGIKLAVVIAGVAGYPFMGLAVVADVGAAVVTVLNSVRAGKI